MKTYKIVILLVAIVAGVLSLVAWNAFRAERKFVVLTSDKYDFCFLVDEITYKLDTQGSTLKYSGGKNSGELKLERRGLSKDIHLAKINGFEGGYKKSPNKRIFEYLVAENVTLSDVFIYQKKAPLNLVPYREDCTKIKERYPNHRLIFENI